jgi:hypothetical protein
VQHARREIDAQASAANARPCTSAEIQKSHGDDSRRVVGPAIAAMPGALASSTFDARAITAGGIVTPKSAAAARSITMLDFEVDWNGIGRRVLAAQDPDHQQSCS